MTRKVFILTETIYKRFKTMNKIKPCHSCGKNFKIGDKVESISRNRSSHKWVCIKCARKYKIW